MAAMHPSDKPIIRPVNGALENITAPRQGLNLTQGGHSPDFAGFSING
jgi:hypothetical protein